VESFSQNGSALNDYKGHHSNTKGLLSMEEAKTLSATPVSPSTDYQTVFIFPIHNALEWKAVRNEGFSVIVSARALISSFIK
jgi:hypothetical protein